MLIYEKLKKKGMILFMNYFIDFDHTLYNTKLLVEKMLDALCDFLSIHSIKTKNDIAIALKEKFKRGNDGIYDIYKLIEFFNNDSNYSFEIKEANQIINNVILNGSIFLYKDALPFLQYLKSLNNKIYILSYNENNLYYQTLKILGSEIIPFINGIIPTSTLKGDMPLDFSNSVFIDDKPKDLISIYNKKPYQIYRIKRENDTYSNQTLNIPIQEFDSLISLQNYLNDIN